MSTSTNITRPDDRREAVRALAAASLVALDGIEKAKLADIADIRAKLQDALRWGDGSRLPQSAKLYRKTQQSDGVDTWWYRLDGDGEEMGCVLHTVFDWITGSNERTVDLDDGMWTLREAVTYHVRGSDPLVSAACAAACYDESRLAVHDEGQCDAEAREDANVVSLEDARTSKEMAELRDSIAHAKEQADAQCRKIDEVTSRIYALLRGRGAHLSLVTNDVHPGTESLRTDR